MKVCNFIFLISCLFFSCSLSAVDQKIKKVALIFGVTGQDGRYLSEFLLEKGYEVHGVKRRASSFNTQRIDHLIKERKENPAFFLHYGDVTDSTNVMRLIQEIQPDEVYNLAAQSHVRVSFEMPEYTSRVDALGTLHILEAIKNLELIEKTRFYQASTSELFGNALAPQNELTPFMPRSPYAISKLYAYWITVNYRQAYGLFACNGILFNHESPFRGETFVTRKITRAVGRIKHGLQDIVYLGNLDAQRDWGFAGDYVKAMWLMLQQDVPDDYVIATGKTHSVRKFVELAFACVGVHIQWQGKGINERGLDAQTGKVIVAIDPIYFRPTEVDLLIGDARKAHEQLQWFPEMNFEDLVKLMVEQDELEVLQTKKGL